VTDGQTDDTIRYNDVYVRPKANI